MNVWKIKKTLIQIGKQELVFDHDSKEKRIEQLLGTEVEVTKQGSVIEFFFVQIKFVNKMVFFWQGLWILLFSFAISKGGVLHLPNEVLCILSMAPPLLLLFTVEAMAQVYHRSMLEIEYTTKYSLKKIVMMRMLIFSIGNGVLLLIGMLFAKYELGIQLSKIFVYGITPLLWMSVLLLLCMQYLKGEQMTYAATYIYVFLALILLVGRMEKVQIYRKECYGVWGVLCVMGVIGLLYQWIRLLNHLEKFETVVS